MVWQPKGPKVYISSDGDDIGSKVSASILSGNIASAKKLSLLINLGGKLTEKFAKTNWDGHVIILGGDDLMVVAPATKFDPAKVEDMRKLYHSRIKATLSCGIGSAPEEAMKSLVIAKNTGKNKAVFWDDSMQATYMKVVKARINDLKTKLAAQSSAKNENIIPPELKSHIRKEFHKLIRERKKRNAKLSKSRSSTSSGDSQGRGLRKPTKITPKLKKPKPTAMNNSTIHRNSMIDLMRSFIIHHKMKYDKLMSYASRASGMGDHKAANAFRTEAKLLTKKVLRNHAVIHTATQLGNGANIPYSIRSKLKMIRNSIAKRKRDSRKLPKAPVAPIKRAPSRQLKAKPFDRNVAAKPSKNKPKVFKPQTPKPPQAPKPPIAGKPPKITKTQIFGKSKKFKVRKS